MDKRHILVTAYKERIEKINALIKSYIDSYDSELSALKEELKKLQGDESGQIEQETNNEGYNMGSSWWEKARFILRREKRALSTPEIVMLIMQIEDGLDRRKTVKLISNGITSKLGRQIKRTMIKGEGSKFELIED